MSKPTHDGDKIHYYVADQVRALPNTRWLDAGVREALVEQISERAVGRLIAHKRLDRRIARGLIASLLFWVAGVTSWALVSVRSDFGTGLIAVLGSVCIGMAIITATQNPAHRQPTPPKAKTP